MNFEKVNIKTNFIIIVLGFLFLPNFLMFIDFISFEKSNCCMVECQCTLENHCQEMTFSRSSTNVVLLIPLYNLEKYNHLHIFELQNIFNRIDVEYSQNENIDNTESNQINIKSPPNLTNAPLLI